MQPINSALMSPFGLMENPEAVIGQELQARIGGRSFEHWFRDKTRLVIRDGHLTILVPNAFLLKWMQKQFRQDATLAAQIVLGPEAAVRFEVEATAPETSCGASSLETQLSRETTSPELVLRALPVPPLHIAGHRDLGEQGVLAGHSGIADHHDAPLSFAGSLQQATVASLASRPALPVVRQSLEATHSREHRRPSHLAAEHKVPAKSPVSPTVLIASRPAVPAKSTVAATPAAATVAPRNPLEKPRPGRRYADLSDFVTGTCNELAATAVRHTCQYPDGQNNPLFIYGGVGIGKTHLIEGLYRQIKRQHPSLQVLLLSAEAFTNHFTLALRDHTLPSFRQKFRTVDVLVVDDVDFLDAKRVIQEEFLHTFKQLESLGKQIVLSADRHPRLLTKMSDELKSRFLSGMVCRIDSPDLETRLAITTRKAARLNAEFSDEALRYVAERFPANVREIEGALNSLANYHTMTGKKIGISTARHVLADLERDCVKVVRIADIERVVCELFGLEAEELKSARRTRSLSQPRMLAMYLARKLTSAAYSEIGDYFGGRNHSTVISAERKVRSQLETEGLVRVSRQNWKIPDLVDMVEQQVLAS